MNNSAGNEDEINLLELLQVLLLNKKLLITIPLLVALASAGGSLLMKNIYRADVLVTAAQSGDAKGGISSALGGLSGLASLAGVSIGGGGSTDESIAVLQSRDFLWKFVNEQKILPLLFADEWDADAKQWKENDPQRQPGQMDVYRLFNSGMLSVDKDKKTSLITISINWTDKVLAAAWANAITAQLNQYLAQQAIQRSNNNLRYLNEELARTPIEDMRKTLYDLLSSEQRSAMLANTQKDFAFRVIDPAITPDKKLKPKRAIIVVVSTLVSLFLTILWIFIREGYRKQKELNQETLAHGASSSSTTLAE